MSYCLRDLVQDLRLIEWEYRQACRLADESRAAGAPVLGSIAAYNLICSAEHGRQGDERRTVLAAKPGVDRVRTICIAHSREFSAGALLSLCASVGPGTDMTLDEFLNLDIEHGADLLEAGLAPPSAGGADRGETGGTMVGLRSFIVHGHDETAKLALKNYLQNTLGWPEPVILAEKPSGGKTIIEKFDEYSKNIDVVFVLLTPDDMAGAVGTPSAARARQNVILELGHFSGNLGRSSGRVILLHKGDLELPSDLAGIVYIDISNGVEAAGEKIRKEVAMLVRIN